MLTRCELALPVGLPGKQVTLYRDTDSPARALLFYLHGGALLYGSRDDLPAAHVERMCAEGCILLALDYPLAPACQVGEILQDVEASICYLLSSPYGLWSTELPYLLWGRSAGAWLCLLLQGRLEEHSPAGIISYYGYGLLAGNWINCPSAYYLRFPAADPSCLRVFSQTPVFHAEISTHFAAYVYLRQKGLWGSVIGAERPETLRRPVDGKGKTPLFLAHAVHDPDVPFAEFYGLVQRDPQCARFTAQSGEHDFDRDGESELSRSLLTETAAFLENCLRRSQRLSEDE